jgi:GNAT superfamily N-acetyltransferase
LFVGRLAVDQRYQGQGAGRALLMSALGRSLEIRVRVDAIGVIVDAKMIERERSMSSTVSSASNLTHNALSS